MKNILILLFGVGSIALAALSVKLWRTHTAAEQRLNSVRAKLEQSARQAAEMKATAERATQQQTQLVKLSEDLGKELKAREEAEKKAQEAAQKAAEEAVLKKAAGGDQAADDQNDLGKMISSMMKDPEMKKMIRGQQRMMMDQLYDPLIKRLDLSSEQAEKFKDLLSDNMMKATEKATSMFGASTNRAEMMQELEADQKAADEQMKELLGEAGFGEYQDYQKTSGERMQLNMFKQQLSSDHPLTDVQTEQLLAFMAEEKKNLEASTGQQFPKNGADKQSLEAILSEEQSAKLLEAQRTINQRVFDRAGSVLGPEQLAAFEKFQTSQLDMMRLGFGMARKLMGSGSASTPGS